MSQLLPVLGPVIRADGTTVTNGKCLIRVVVVVQRHTKLFQVVDALRPASELAVPPWIAGSNKATKIPMMAMTTKSSTRVNPFRLNWIMTILLTGTKTWKMQTGKSPSKPATD